MANINLLLLLLLLLPMALASRHLTAEVPKQPVTLAYHNGRLLTGPISIHLIWYGNFTAAQRAVVSDLVASLSSPASAAPSVADWWRTTAKYFPGSRPPALSLAAEQPSDEACSLGKRLTSADVARIAARGGRRRAINVVLTAADVAVEGFCVNRCGTHGASPRSRAGRYAYVWVGNAAAQCPGLCAWPFHRPAYGPQDPPLVAPNGDVGADGMVINLAGLLAGTVTNPFGNGYFQGPRGAALEAATACAGVYGRGAYPGYAGQLLVDPVTGGSYNAAGVNGRKYLLPALVDPVTAACSTLT